jgi:hypothetical protein
MIDRMQQHFGFATMPFGRDLAPATLHRHASHTQAAARITWTITEKTLGVITGPIRRRAGPGRRQCSARPVAVRLRRHLGRILVAEPGTWRSG